MAGETLRGCPTFEAGMSLLNGQLGDPNPYEVQAQITVTWNENHGVSRSPICAITKHPLSSLYVAFLICYWVGAVSTIKFMFEGLHLEG